MISYTTGIFLFSTMIFVVYVVIKMNKPVVYSESIVPSMVSGAMWAVASAGFQIANGTLGMTVGT